MAGVLVTRGRDPLFGLSRAEALEFLSTSLRGRALEAYVFGSFARDDMHADSDIDCIIVTETEVSFPARGGIFDDLRDRLPSLEMLVYTPDEFDALTRDPTPGFWSCVVRDLVRLL